MGKQGFKRILLATDGSEQATAAVGVTASFARASSASVLVVHVWNLEVHHRHGVWDVEVRTEADALLKATVTLLQESGVETDGMISRADHSHIAAAIAEAARTFNADLVVVGSRGLSDWASLVQHSTSHQLLSFVDCPLLIVRSSSAAATHLAQRVVLAVAGGDDLVPAARAAAAAASAPGSEVLVVHVAQCIVGVQGYAYVEPEEEIRATISHATACLEAEGITAGSFVAEPGPVAEAVARIAAGWRADVIAIGSSRIGDLGSLLIGSVTHDLLRATDRPVLVAERIRA
jgi:nucleotide-binding universal stress UspA family protein